RPRRIGMRSVSKYSGVTYVMLRSGTTSSGDGTPAQRPPMLSARSYGSVRHTAALCTPGIAWMRSRVASNSRLTRSAVVYRAACSAAGCGANEALRQELTHDGRAPSAQRQARRDFWRAPGAAREEQPREVHAADEQHDADRGPQDEQRPARVLRHALLERDEA